MGRIVEVPADGIAWPERCCCRAGKAFTWRPFSEKVVVSTVLSVTKCAGRAERPIRHSISLARPRYISRGSAGWKAIAPISS